MSTGEIVTSASTTAVDPDLVVMLDGVFADYRASTVAVSGGRVLFDRELWQRLDGLGLVRLTGSAETGGSGASWLESAALLGAAVRHGVRLPLAEHDLLTCWLLDALGEPVDDAVRTLYMPPMAGREAPPVPWAAEAERLVVLWKTDAGHRVTELDTADISICTGANLIGEPRDRPNIDTTALSGRSVPPDLVRILRRKSALIRAIQLCTALDQAVAMSIQHVMSRVQFGRPLAKFQSIQNLISDAAAEAALARAATDAALLTADDSDWGAQHLDFQIATARSCAGHAASTVTRNAHQVHGAMGTTLEHRLHEYTRAALAWRSEFGSVGFWDAQVCSAAVDAGRQQLWALITEGS